MVLSATSHVRLVHMVLIVLVTVLRRVYITSVIMFMDV